MKDMDMDMSQFDMNDFKELMDSIRKVGLMQWMKKEMGGEESKPKVEIELETGSEGEEDEDPEFSPFLPKEKFLDDSEDSGMEEEMPKKKEYTFFDVKNERPQKSDSSGAERMMKKMLRK